MSSGNEFHAEGSAIEQERFPNYELDLGKVRCLCRQAKGFASLDLRDVGAKMLKIYVDACPLSVQCLAYQQATIILHSLRDTQPVKFVPH